ncbi:MAG: TonB-dependent receptor [Sphingomicrobium sp.]
MLGFTGRFATSRALKCSASTLVLGVALLQPTTAFAQTQTDAGTPSSASTDPNPAPAAEAEPVGKNAIIITGQRRALRTSQQIKKNADTVVDSITANDIGSFPDKSVAEALQRVPGITVNRFAATGDTSHFSAEPSGVLIRGLTQVRSEFNGRDVFSANSGRGLNWSDVTPELLAGVDVYKNQTADLIEGGIAGSVNLKTRVPFDATGQLIQLGIRANYGDLKKKWTPDINGFYSNRWQTGIGEFGIMGDVAFSQVKTRSQGIQFYRVGIFENGLFPNSAGVTSSDFPTGTVTAPSQITFRNNDYDRKRLGIAAAGQWRSNDHKWLATAQFLRSSYSEEWNERTFGSNFFGIYGQTVRFRNPAPPAAAPGAPPFTFDDNGFVETGTFNQTGGWWGVPGANQDFGVNDQGQPMFNACYTWGQAPECEGRTYGEELYNSSRLNKTKTKTQDLALNLKWEPTPDLRFNFDGQYINSTVNNYDIEIDMGSFANVGLDNTGTYPRITLSDPTNVNQSAGGLSNPNNWFIRSVMDHLEASKGHEYALRGDGEYDFHSDWLDSLKFGARYADRKQKVQWSTYNWQNISNTWTGGCAYLYFNLDSQPGTCNATTPPTVFNGYPAGSYETSTFGAPFLGGNLGTFPFVPFNFLRNRGANLFSRDRIGVGNFIPICERNGQIPGVTPVELDNSCFTPDEVADVDEKTAAAYAMLKWGGDNLHIGGMTLRGNIGLRYVNTKDASAGSISFPTIGGLNPAQCPATPLVPGGLTGTGVAPSPLPAGSAPFPSFCYLTPQDLAFASGGGENLTAKAKHINWLPSFNARLDVARNWIVRFAASKAISRPDIGLLKNFQRVAIGLPNNLSDPRWILGPGGLPIGVNPTYTEAAFNPYLKPIRATQFDLSFEHYFGNEGQISFALFHKKFDDYIQYGSFVVPVTANGVTRDVTVTGPSNGSGAKIQGLEAAFQTYFNFLPKPFDGLGIQANYTYVKNKGVANTSLGTPTQPSNTGAGSNNTALDPGTLEGLSKHTFNLVGMYDKGPISARLAYNWRSQYLVTAVDCCVYLPVWQKSAGFLDATLKYTLNDSIELGLQASNLLNTKTVLLQQITDKNSPEGKNILVPNAWFQNDRKLIVSVRWKMGKY